MKAPAERLRAPCCDNTRNARHPTRRFPDRIPLPEQALFPPPTKEARHEYARLLTATPAAAAA
ncbi:MAG: hypothetical protein J5838_02820 [Desulfovibrio sp.]|nr:hypothetical protein [Desulfovibrio sp.]